jgi:hypothetical protein
MRVVWIAHSDAVGLHTDPSVLCYHWSAGRRLRAGIPSVRLHSLGVRQWLLSPPSKDGLEQALELRPDVVVVSGLYPNVEGRRDPRSYFNCVDAFQRNGVPVVVDMAEDHFQDYRAAEFREMIDLGDGLIVNTPALADIVREKTSRESDVIDDPVEGAECDPVFDPPQLRSGLFRLAVWGTQPRPLRLLWFGGQGRNYQYLKRLVPELQVFARVMPIDLTVVAGPLEGLEADVAAWNSHSQRFRARSVMWSRGALEHELSRCDIVIIPSDVAARMAASTNRIAESIWAGRFVVANGLPSYWVFREAAWIGENMIEGLRWALHHREKAVARIVRGQTIIVERFTPDVIGRRWGEVLARYCLRRP